MSFTNFYFQPLSSHTTISVLQELIAHKAHYHVGPARRT